MRHAIAISGRNKVCTVGRAHSILRGRIGLRASLLALCLLATACADTPANRQIQNARTLLNQRRYAEVLAELALPLSPEAWRLRAHAELGAAGFELFGATARVMGEQNFETDHRGWLNEKDCSPASVDPAATSRLPPACVFVRLENQVASRLGPAREKAEAILRAEEIYRVHFDRVESQSAQINFEASLSEALALLVHYKTLRDAELARALSGYSTLAPQPRAALERVVIGNLKGVVDRAFGVLRTLRGSYRTLVNFLRVQDGRTLLELHGQKLVLTPDFSKRQIQDFTLRVYASLDTDLRAQAFKAWRDLGQRARELIPADARSGQSGEQLDQWIDEFTARASRTTADLASSALNLFFGSSWTLPSAAWPPMRRAGDRNLVGASPTMFRARSLRSALERSWDLESADPVREWWADNLTWIRGIAAAVDQAQALRARLQDPELRAYLDARAREFATDADLQNRVSALSAAVDEVSAKLAWRELVNALDERLVTRGGDQEPAVREWLKAWRDLANEVIRLWNSNE